MTKRVKAAWGALVLVITGAMGTGTAWAELNLSPTSNFPYEATLGDSSLRFLISVINTSNEIGNANDPPISVNLTELGLIPSCVSFGGTDACFTPELDVFDIETGSAAAAGIDGACVGTTFTVSERDGTGRQTIAPDAPVVLGPSDGSGGPTICTLEMTIVEVMRLPTTDVQPAVEGVQTWRSVDAQIVDPVSGRRGSRSETALATVFPSRATIFTESEPNIFAGTSPVPPGSEATDTATVIRINPETNSDPTGTVTLTLMGPDPDSACTGPVAFGPETVAIDPATGQATSSSSGPLNDQGLYNWVATFESGDNNYEDVPGPVGCNEDQERFVVQQVPIIEIDKTADPLEQNEPGGTFTFDVVVTNPGVNELTITSLTDDVYGDLNDPANPNVDNNTCAGAVGTTLAPNGGTFSCSFDGEFTGNAGDSETDTVTVTGEDNLAQEATDSDDATVTLVGVPPMLDLVKTADPTSQPGVPPAVDIVKTADPTSQLGRSGFCPAEPSGYEHVEMSHPADVNGNGFVCVRQIKSKGNQGKNTNIKDNDGLGNKSVGFVRSSGPCIGSFHPSVYRHAIISMQGSPA